MMRLLVADDRAIVREGRQEILVLGGDLVVAGEATQGNDLLKTVREQ